MVCMVPPSLAVLVTKVNERANTVTIYPIRNGTALTYLIKVLNVRLVKDSIENMNRMRSLSLFHSSYVMRN